MWLGGSDSVSLRRLPSSWQPSLQSAQGLTGAVRSGFGFFTCLLRGQLAVGHTSVPCYMDSPLGCFPQSEWSSTGRELIKEAIIFLESNLQMWHTITSAVCYWSHRPLLVQCGRVWILGVEEFLGNTVKAVYHKVYEMSKGKYHMDCWVYFTVAPRRDLGYT